MSRLAAAVAGVAALAVLLFPVTVAQAQSSDVAASTSADSWYRPLPGLPAEASTCDLPIGCAPAVPLPVAPPSQYPAGTLHVGVGAGVEESRTYLTLDLSAVPDDARLIGGTLTLPLATEPEAGTVVPEMAKLRACLVEEFVRDDVEGDPTGAPTADCTTTSPATFVPAAGGGPASFEVDLDPFVGGWFGSGSLALVPDEAPAPTDTWHLAFSGHDRSVDDALKVSARLQVREDRTAERSEFEPELSLRPPDPPDTDFSVRDDSLSVDPSASFAAAPLVPSAQLSLDAAPAASASQPALVAAQAPLVTVVAGRYAYPGVFLLPLAVAFGVAWAGRAFTRDLSSEAR